MNYVKSKQRVADHVEVFTPAWMVAAMLDGERLPLARAAQGVQHRADEPGRVAFRRYEDASLRHTGIDSHRG